jgi:ribose transport system substrate-binding protein
MSSTKNNPIRAEPIRRNYRVGTLEKALDVLEAIERAVTPVSAQELALATGVQRTAVYRLLSTLAVRGYVQRLPDSRYTISSRRRRLSFGYMAPLSGNAFREQLLHGLSNETALGCVDFTTLHNEEGDSAAALLNVQELIDRRVDLAIMFQPVGAVGLMVADRFANADIPLIAVETPVPGAFYFGANNYQAGRLAGGALGRFSAQRWKGTYDRIVLIESSLSSPSVQARVTGVLEGLSATIGPVPESRVIHLDGRGHLEESRHGMAELLRKHGRQTRFLISGFNDLAALGSLQALRQAGREEHAAVVGQNASTESHAELRNPRSRLIMSVAYFPERYGVKLVRLGLSVVNREAVHPALYTGHLALTCANIDQYYPRGKR